MLANVTDEQCLRFRHKSKAFYTTALKLEVMKTAVVPTAHCWTAPAMLVIIIVATSRVSPSSATLSQSTQFRLGSQRAEELATHN